MRPRLSPLLLSVLFTVLDAESRQCPQSAVDKIQNCVQPVARYAEFLGVGMGGAGTGGSPNIIPNMRGGKEVFQELCRHIETFEQCVRVPRIECPEHITLSLINASYGYLCNEGRQRFMTNADCLMLLDQEAAVRHCHDNTLHVIKASSEQKELSLKEKMHRMCQSLNYFAGCVQTPVRSRCGEDAWKVISRVLAATTTTLMPNCAFEPPPLPETSVQRPSPPPRVPSARATTQDYDRYQVQIQKTDRAEVLGSEPEHKFQKQDSLTKGATTSLDSFTLTSILLLADVVRWLLPRL